MKGNSGVLGPTPCNLTQTAWGAWQFFHLALTAAVFLIVLLHTTEDDEASSTSNSLGQSSLRGGTLSATDTEYAHFNVVLTQSLGKLTAKIPQDEIQEHCDAGDDLLNVRFNVRMDEVTVRSRTATLESERIDCTSISNAEHLYRTQRTHPTKHDLFFVKCDDSAWCSLVSKGSDHVDPFDVGGWLKESASL